MNKYFTVIGVIDGEYENLFGSFDRADCVSEIECEKSTWKEQGYKRIKIQSKNTTDVPDRSVYENIVSKVDLVSFLESISETEENIIDYLLDELITNCGKDFFINSSEMLDDIKLSKNTVKIKLVQAQKKQKSFYDNLMANLKDFDLDLSIGGVDYYTPNDETEYIVAVSHHAKTAVETAFYESDDFIYQGEKTEYSFYVSNGLLMSDY